MDISLSFVSVICRDVTSLAGFYRDVFELKEVDYLTTEHFRGLRIGETVLGFGAKTTFDMLNLPSTSIPNSGTAFWTFEVDTEDDVATLTRRATDAGATCLKQPARTYYRSWQSVLHDPEGNAFRINKTS
jgi:predicted enzyme related to lactoylglutathione lyase